MAFNFTGGTGPATFSFTSGTKKAAPDFSSDTKQISFDFAKQAHPISFFGLPQSDWGPLGEARKLYGNERPLVPPGKQAASISPASSQWTEVKETQPASSAKLSKIKDPSLPNMDRLTLRSRTGYSAPDDTDNWTDSSGPESEMTKSDTSEEYLSRGLPSLQTQTKYLKGSTAHELSKLRQNECETAPLFSAEVFTSIQKNTFRQYGLLAGESNDLETATSMPEKEPESTPTASERDSRIFLNVAAPWSAFICGSQGSGKSHTLSCILENCLLPNKDLGRLDNPLTGIVFHYDRFTSYGSNQICEAAYLCSSGVPVKVLVSPTNYQPMKQAYENLPGLPRFCQKPKVIPLQLRDSHLNVERMMKMMAVSDSDGPPPLYIEVIHRILRDMATSTQGIQGFDYKNFRRLLANEPLIPTQKTMMNMRLDLLESFLHPSMNAKKPKHVQAQDASTWDFPPGGLTIVDLSCPFVDANSACALFNICLGIFLEQRRTDIGRVIALDEAHKFLTRSESAAEFTEELLGVIRQQRHLGARVIIATQEPTLSDKLIDLSSFTVVHRFTSPAWFAALRGHLAGVGARVGDDDEKEERARDAAGMFDEIVRLGTGEALMFCPSAMLRTESIGGLDGVPKKLGGTHLRVRVRARLTTDGGRSVMAG